MIDVIKSISIGSGFCELETHEPRPYRWISDKCTFYINDKNIKTVTLHIESSIDCKILDVIGAKILEKSNTHIKLDVTDSTITIKFEHFVPQIVIGTSDTRKLSYKLLGITIDDKTIPIESVFHIPDKLTHTLYSAQQDISIVEYGEYGEMFIKTSKNNIDGKINLNSYQTSFYAHRSGWNNVIQSLFDLHNDNGIHFDGFLENTFVWKKQKFISTQRIPYKTDWIGVFHNPPNMPAWFSDNGGHPNSILTDIVFKQSLKCCKGIYVLSQYHANYLKLFIPEIPINVLYHPTEIPNNLFTYDKFVNNPNKSIVTIGWWLRKLNSFFKLKSSYKKIQISSIEKCKTVVERLRLIEKLVYDIQISENEYKSVEIIDQLSNDDYDEVLSKNIVYLNLYDSSANNSIIECIARRTPLLVNKLPAVVEYLGEDYPFYFRDEEEAEAKLNDTDLIYQTHTYLCNFENRKKILMSTFIEDFKNSFIYRSL